MPPPLPSNKKRLHDLDALRAFAMLLGILLHAFLTFIPTPIWPAQDIHQPEWSVPDFLKNSGLDLPSTISPFAFLLDVIHGFRMQLFFLISGFFTAMMWKKRGTAALLKHRAKRILLPLIIGTAIIWPLVALAAVIGGISKADHSQRPDTVWTAAKTGDIDALEEFLADGTNPDALDPISGISALTWTACTGQSEAATLLLKNGANPNQRDRDGGTPLHGAAFFGNANVGEILLKNDAAANLKNNRGDTPTSLLKTDFDTVNFIASLLEISVDTKVLEQDRERLSPLLANALEKQDSESEVSPQNKNGDPFADVLSGVGGLIFGAAMIPVFHHLWFLHYLCWLVILFVIAALIHKKKFARKWFPKIGWLIPLAIIPQLFMFMSFGPDTATGILLWPPKLAYYAVFFAVGVLCYQNEHFADFPKRHWLKLILSALPLFLISWYFFNVRNSGYSAGFEEDRDRIITAHVIYSVTAVAYAWLMIFGMLGIFRRYFPGENRRVRYLSDASYWLYIAHLPVMFFVQIFVSTLPIPIILKLVIICGLTVGGLLIVYQLAVRYTFVGIMLNGKKIRPSA